MMGDGETTGRSGLWRLVVLPGWELVAGCGGFLLTGFISGLVLGKLLWGMP